MGFLGYESNSSNDGDCFQPFEEFSGRSEAHFEDTTMSASNFMLDSFLDGMGKQTEDHLGGEGDDEDEDWTRDSTAFSPEVADVSE